MEPVKDNQLMYMIFVLWAIYYSLIDFFIIMIASQVSKEVSKLILVTNVRSTTTISKYKNMRDQNMFYLLSGKTDSKSTS